MTLRDKLQGLVEARVNIWEETMKPLVLQDSMTPEEQTTYAAAEEELEQLDSQIDEVTRAIKREANEQESAEKRAEMLQATQPGISPEGVLEQDERYSRAFWDYIRFGEDRVSDEDQALLESRALGSASDTAGGFLVPQDFWNEIIMSRDAFGGLRNAPVTVINTDNGRDLPVPTDADAGVMGEIVDENDPAQEGDPAFGQVMFKAYLYSSKLVKVPRTLMTDNAFNLEAYLAGIFGRRIGRIQALHLAVGTGDGQPEGIIEEIAEGAETSAADVITYENLVTLEHSVNPAYRANGHYLLSDGALRIIRLLKDSDGHPLWSASIAADVPATINGFPYTVVQELPAPSAGTTSVVFGDVSYYWIRDVEGFEALRLNELFAQNRQVGFLAWARSDGRNVNPGNDPYKGLTQGGGE